ncbi:hypothetical protein BS78_09G022500 [Paspalum vaginatum]|nr:hypothetical protein BS78_09G022500 [Paspalum vaginatum]
MNCAASAGVHTVAPPPAPGARPSSPLLWRPAFRLLGSRSCLALCLPSSRHAPVRHPAGGRPSQPALVVRGERDDGELAQVENGARDCRFLGKVIIWISVCDSAEADLKPVGVRVLHRLCPPTVRWNTTTRRVRHHLQVLPLRTGRDDVIRILKGNKACEGNAMHKWPMSSTCLCS